MKLAILDGFPLNENRQLEEAFASFNDVKYYDRTSVTDQDLIVERAQDCEGILTNKVPVTKELLARLPKLRYIGITATGYNIVDLEACEKAGVTVTNIPAYSTEAVAQFTFALILEIYSKVGLHNQLVHQGVWQTRPDFTFWAAPLRELKDKTIGLIGFGAIGQEVAKNAAAFSMKVIFYNHRLKEHPKEIQQVSLEELLKKADIVSLHVPLFEETSKMVNEKFLSQMKPDSLLINTARGGLVDEVALKDALNQGIIGAYAADVVSEEPIEKDNPLLQARNCYLTPHIAWAPLETRQRLIGIAVDNLQAFEKGMAKNVVTKG